MTCLLIAIQHKSLFYNNSTGPRHATVTLPGLLKTRKTKLVDANGRNAEGSTFTGFNATSFKLDLGESKTSAYDSIASYKPDPVTKASEVTTDSSVDNVLVPSEMSQVLSLSNSNYRSKPKKETTATENTLEELRSYITEILQEDSVMLGEIKPPLVFSSVRCGVSAYRYWLRQQERLAAQAAATSGNA